MTFPPPHHSAQSSIASGTDKSSSTRPEIGAWGRSTSQSSIRRGLTPLATNLSSNATSASARGFDTGPGVSTATSFSAVLSSTRGLSGGSPKPAPSPFSSLQSGSQQSAQSLSSPKFRAHTPSAGSYFASVTGSIPGVGGTGGGGGPGSSRGVAFSPLSSGTTVNSPTGFASDKAGSATHSSQSSLAKISIAQVYLLLDSITEKEGKEKWDTKAAQIHKVSLTMANGLYYLTR